MSNLFFKIASFKKLFTKIIFTIKTNLKLFLQNYRSFSKEF